MAVIEPLCLALPGRSLQIFTVFIAQLSPSLVLLRILVYEKWLLRVRLAFILFIALDCLFRSGPPQRSPVIQIAVIPFEINMARDVNLDDYAVPPIWLLAVLSIFPSFPDPDVSYWTWYLNSLMSSSPTVAANSWQRFAKAS